MPDRIDTNGGAFVKDSVNTGRGNFIGRDQVVVIHLAELDEEQLDKVLASLQKMLGDPRVELHPDSGRAQLTVRAPGAAPLTLSEDAGKELLGRTGRRGDVRAYLSALVVHPRYSHWGSRFVPLAGTLSEQKKPPGWSEIPAEFAELEVRGEGPQRQVQRVKLNDITEAMQRHRGLVLLGEPGSGKTTTLERLLLDSARAALRRDSDCVPLLLPLAGSSDASTPRDFLASRWRQQVGTGDLEDRLRHGRLLLLCDALNEMPFRDQDDYRARVKAWRELAHDLPAGNRVVFTCRSIDYSVPLGLPQVEIARLDDPRVEDFLHRYLDPADPELAAGAWEKLRGSALLELMRNPWYLTMLAWLLAAGEGWPESRAGLFKRFVTALLIREGTRNHPDWPGEEALGQALAVLAEAMQPLGEGTSLARSEAVQKLPETVQCQDGPVAIAPAVALDLGLAATLLDTTEPGEGGARIKFYHHQIQEYFAARALLMRFEQGGDPSAYWHRPRLAAEMPEPGWLGNDEPLPPPPTTGWEEPTVLAAGLARDRAAFVDNVRWINPVLAARCLREPGLEHPAGQEAAVQADLLAMMGEPRVHLRARLGAGDELGRLGDPRFEEIRPSGKRVLLPPLAKIPAGSFRMGSSWWEVRFGQGTAHERPRHTVTLPAFRIGQYPVTNAEFACFVDDGGYHNEDWWETERAKAWLRGELENEALEDWVSHWKTVKADPSRMNRLGWSQRNIDAWTSVIALDEAKFRELVAKAFGQRPMDRPVYWDDARYNAPSQPVVGVTWFEARAYCRWHTERWRAAGEDCREALPAGATVGLPTEAQWERAARFPAGSRYPWGRDWVSERANTEEGHVLRPSPVGVYPGGTSAAGVHDLAGNVWEWTLSCYRDYPVRPEDRRDDPESAGPRVLRGGSWHDDRGDARCASRVRVPPVNFGSSTGFRVVLSLANSEF